mgnify:FL=1
MRSVKGIIIGFRLILLGFAAAQYSLIAAGILAAGGLAVVIVSALPKRTEKRPPQAAPAAPEPAPAELSAPELLPDILTDPPVQPEPPAPPKPEAEALYKTLAEAYTRIDALSCRGPAWMLERDIRLCKAFCARWDGAKADAQTAALLRERARFVDYSDEFLLPGFGKHGRIPGRRTSGDLLEDLSAAVLKQTARQQTALETALRAQKWFESIKKQLRHIRPEPADASAPASKPEYTPPDAEPLTRGTAPEALETFFVLALKTTGKSPSRDEIVQLSLLKFRRFAPESVLTAYVRPEKGLTKYARETGVTERMTQDAPTLAQLLPAVGAYLGEDAPLVLFRADDLAFLGAAGSEAACAKRPVYDVRTLTGHKTAPLAEAFGAAFEFVPSLADAEDEALACGLIFCTLADRVLHLTAKR